MLAFGAASNFAGPIDSVFWVVCAISAVMMVLITVSMLYFVVRYHRKRSPHPTQMKDSMALELTWTFLPTVLVMGIFWYGWVVFKDLRTIPKDAMPVDVTGAQWKWSYTYANGRTRTGREGLILPVNRPVHLKMTTNDVLHAFFVPAFRLKEDLLPRRETYLSFTPTVVGEFDVFCAEYCGGTGDSTDQLEDGHWSMRSKVVVVSQQDFDRWYSGQTAEVTQPAAAPPPTIEKVLSTKCFSCHSTDGSEMYGPTFKGLFAKKKRVVLVNGEEKEVDVDEAYVRRSITDPGAEMVAEFARHPKMDPVKDLSEEQTKAILEYLKELK